ncbi:MAG: hypothetical protein JXQ75_14905 [Phycisphaerae bacterium]|nr:hypothetical protein [Phycisphaerae bacterium]
MNPNARRAGLIGLVALAVTMVSVVVVVMTTEDTMIDADEAFPDPVVVDPAKRPEFVFPESVRTFDLSLNRFVDRFARVCMDGKYSDFRLMLSSRAGDPIVASRFESMFNALKQVRILAIDKLSNVPGFDHPVYIMLAEYDVEDYAATEGKQSERRRLAIVKESGEWRIGPIPHNVLATLQAIHQPATQPAPAEGGPLGSDGDDAQTPDTPRAAANRPVRLAP